MNKLLSERHFVAVIYSYLLMIEDANPKRPLNPEEKEELARIAVGLHKEFWERYTADAKSN